MRKGKKVLVTLPTTWSLFFSQKERWLRIKSRWSRRGLPCSTVVYSFGVEIERPYDRFVLSDFLESKRRSQVGGEYPVFKTTLMIRGHGEWSRMSIPPSRCVSLPLVFLDSGRKDWVCRCNGEFLFNLDRGEVEIGYSLLYCELK